MTSAEAARLSLALLLPWAAGSLWIHRWNPAATPAGRLTLALGYGYFLGMLACTSLLRLALVFGVPPFAFTLAGLMLLGAGALAVTSPPTPARSPASGDRLVSILLLAVILAHLLPTLLEALVRPVYPWDAWTTWVYRARIWFLENSLVSFQPPDAAAAGAYQLGAWNYPLFVSLAHLWPATALGRWSETLVNLPAWLTGPAVALGIHGLARSSLGLSPGWATACSAGFLSIPLAGMHMLLPGYADLWMAGTAGLGLAAMLAAFRREVFLLGLAMLSWAPLVKREGIAWLAAGLLCMSLLYWPRRTALAIALVALLLLLPGFPPEWQNLPLIHIHAELQFHNAFPAFAQAFFLQGSWNLLWLVLTITLLFSLRHPNRPDTRKFLVFTGVALLVLFVIFFLSPESRWARDLTAINRLPLQITPLLILACAMMWRQWISSEE